MPLLSADLVRAVLAQMKRRPCIEAYPGDWLQDDIAGCSLAAQGFWWRAMFLMHAAKPYAHLIGANGQPIGDPEAARRTGCRDLGELRKVVAEIEAAGIPGRTGDDAYAAILNSDDATIKIGNTEWVIDLSPLGIETRGVIYSRRMLKDRRLSLIRFFASPKGQSLIPQTRILTTQTSEVCTPPHARASVEDEEEVGSKGESRDLPGRVQGGVTVPDFEAIRRAVEKLDQSALREHPPAQLVAAWFGDGITEELILETLIDCESDYRGKHWKYLEQILKSRRDNPDQRPGKRRARSGNGNGNGGADGRRNSQAGAGEGSTGAGAPRKSRFQQNVLNED